MRLLLNDFGGYPFVRPLARALAARGHTVRHTWCASLPTTPQGALALRPDDPPTLGAAPIHLAAPLDKYSFARRWRQEREFGRMVARDTVAFRPDVVLSANTPLDAQAMLMRATGAPFVFWLQDLIGVAADRLLRRKIPVAGALVGRHYLAMEARQLRQSAHVVAITDDFRPYLAACGVDDRRVTTIENWAPIEEMPVLPRETAWARETGLDGAFVFLYAGTLALKHNPERLVELARALRGQTVDGRPARVVVLSQGPGADLLRAAADAETLDTLDVRDFLPFERVPEAYATADVLLAVLEPDASAFSVPSKVLASLCAARPLLLSVPPDNLAARLVRRERAGHVVDPSDGAAFLAAAEALMADADARAAMGRRARAYAEQTFRIDDIADRMERVLLDAAAGS